jgi:hypothetical protein
MASHDSEVTPAVGDVVRIVGQPRARYRVKRLDEDGTATLWGGTPMRERYRHVDLDRLRVANDTAVTPTGRSARVGATSKRGARATRAAQTAKRAPGLSETLEVPPRMAERIPTPAHCEVAG